MLDGLPLITAARGIVFGTLVGLVGLYLPDTLTWGEFQLSVIANQRSPLSVHDSTELAAAKVGREG